MNDVDLSYGVLHVRSRDFVGQFAKSSNLRFTVGWKQQQPRVLLLDGEQVLWERQLARVVGAAVADAGVTVVMDWIDPVGKAGRFLALTSNGELLFERLFDGLPTGIAIDPSGEYACCFAAPRVFVFGAPDFYMFDLRLGRELFASSCAPPLQHLARTSYGFFCAE